MAMLEPCRLAPILLSALLCCGCQPHSAGSEQAGAPNILFVMFDDMGKEWVSAYGSESISTPAIDALASDGMRFDNVWSNPQCTPTRLSLLTGQYPFRNGWVNHWDTPRWGHGYFDWRKYPSLAGTLKQAGYATVAAGKWQVNDFRIEPEAMKKHGFDSYAMWTGWEEGVEASAERYWDPYIHTESGSKTYEGQYGTDVFVAHLSEFIIEHKDGPWFAYFPLALPHPPYVTTPAQPDIGDDDEARYRAMVEYGDQAVGQLTALIDELGLRENTIVIVTGDNGSPKARQATMNGRVVRGGKSNTSENGVAVPFVVRWPANIEGGQMSDTLVDFTDLLPTFAELAGAELPENHVIDGQSLAAYLKGESDDGPRSWIMAMGGKNEAAVSENGVENQFVFRDRVIRDKRFKLYIAATPARTPVKLVDLIADPDEAVDLLGRDDPEIQDALARLHAVAKQFPDRDSDPKYTRRAANAWDVDVTVESQAWKRVAGDDVKTANGADENDH
jgi:arylsulfatase A-like enzyme